jgi:L-aspartate oxidase
MKNQLRTDFLVIGSGIAGLTFAIKIAESFPEKKVLIVTKADESESNTKYAQGGIAVVIDKVEDSFQKHIDDTMKAGAGINDRAVVEMVVKEGPARLREFIEWGAQFDTRENGKINLGKEGGHSENRIVHHKDITGFELEQTLIKKISKLPNITVNQHCFAIDLITQHHLGIEVKRNDQINCYGAYVLDQRSHRINSIVARFTVMATGGVGQVYQTTTNPSIATGDGIAMAYRAKAKISDMEFIQFHPTALYEPGKSPAFLISEAVRGYGAYLRDHQGNRFVFDYDPRGELASRDIVAKAIDSEMKKAGVDFVYLDCSHLDQEDFKKHFPTIYDKCMRMDIDPSKDMIPVVPAAHYLCGGIDVDMNGRTSIQQLYACGEVSKTGLHGANRLASNSLLEAVVYAHRIAEDVAKREREFDFKEGIPDWDAMGTTDPRELVLINHTRSEVQQTMSKFVGIVRSDDRLERTQKRHQLWYEETEDLYENTTISVPLCELRNLISVAYLITQQSIQRKKNIGGFYNITLDKAESGV